MEEELKKQIYDDVLNKDEEEKKDSKKEDNNEDTEDLEYIFKELEALKDERSKLDEHFRES